MTYGRADRVSGGGGRVCSISVKSRKADPFSTCGRGLLTFSSTHGSHRLALGRLTAFSRLHRGRGRYRYRGRSQPTPIPPRPRMQWVPSGDPPYRAQESTKRGAVGSTPHFRRVPSGQGHILSRMSNTRESMFQLVFQRAASRSTSGPRRTSRTGRPGISSRRFRHRGPGRGLPESMPASPGECRQAASSP